VKNNKNTITLAMTGASGAKYGLRLLEQLLLAQKTVYFLASNPAIEVIHQETELRMPAQPIAIQAVLTEYYQAAPEQLQVFGLEQWTAPVASGSAFVPSMVICPCTSATLAAVAHGFSRNLIERAADVMIKERRQLIVVHRETPVSVIHLENMLRLAKLGVMILPASPGFYHCPQQVDEIIDFIVARILDHLEIPHHLLSSWGETADDEL
jgi:4-hydroxy-3-polyprenylbenzoate decarboxylase